MMSYVDDSPGHPELAIDGRRYRYLYTVATTAHLTTLDVSNPILAVDAWMHLWALFVGVGNLNAHYDFAVKTTTPTTTVLEGSVLDRTKWVRACLEIYNATSELKAFRLYGPEGDELELSFGRFSNINPLPRSVFVLKAP